MELMPEFRAIELGIYAVYPTRKHLPAKVRVLIEFLADSFSQPTRVHSDTPPLTAIVAPLT